jgi:predicted DNA-binding transcriptional regulator AlpA
MSNPKPIDARYAREFANAKIAAGTGNGHASIGDPPLPTVEDQRVLTVIEAARLIGVSLATLKRIFADGGGPPIVQISKRRVGIRVSDLRRWLDSRVRP